MQAESSSRCAWGHGYGLADSAVVRATVVVAVAGIVVKLAAVIKEIVVAGVYGRSDALEAFLAAALLPALLVNLIAESMNQALGTTLIRVRMQQGAQAARRLYASATLALLLLLTGASVVMVLSAPLLMPLVGSHYGAEKLALAKRLFYALVPLLLISGVASHCAAVLNTLERYAGPALAPLLNSAALIVGVLLFGHRFGIWAMVGAMLAGAVLHAATLVYACHRQGYPLLPRWGGDDEAVREVAGQYGPVLLSGLVASGGLLADQSMAALLPAGSVSALVYGNRFVSVAMSLLAGAVSTSLTPYFSRLVAAGEWEQCRLALGIWARRAWLASVPAALLLMAASPWLVRAAFEHGAFVARDTATVFPVLCLYAVQIPFYVRSRVDYRFLLARRRTDLILWCGTINLALDIVLNLALMRVLGVAGIALSTSLWSISSFMFLRYWSNRLQRAGEG